MAGARAARGVQRPVRLRGMIRRPKLPVAKLRVIALVVVAVLLVAIVALRLASLIAG
jgi:hypothetical protein